MSNNNTVIEFKKPGEPPTAVGGRAVVRNDDLPVRDIQTGLGEVRVQVPK